MSELKNKVISGIAWKVLERFSMQLVSFCVGVCLARLLSPAEFGTVALYTIFLAVASVFVDSGFGMALVQKKEVDELDYNSIFYFNMAVALLFYILLWFAAPFVGRFYNNDMLVPLMRVSSINIIFNALCGVQMAVLNREMRFGITFKVSFFVSCVSGLIGVGMAFLGCGVWSLVVSSCLGGVLLCVLNWHVIGWRPKWEFSFSRLRAMYGFGSKLFFAGLLDIVFTNIYGVLIGKFSSSADLAFYNRGDSFPKMIMDSVNGIIAGVAFPALSKLQHDIQQMKSAVRRMMVMSSFLIFPAMVGVAVVAHAWVSFVLTDKWLQAVPFIQLSCIIYFFWPLHVANQQATRAIGRSDVFLAQAVIKYALSVVSIGCTFKYGVMGLMLGRVGLSLISLIVNLYPNKKLINYSLFEQFKDLAPCFLMALAMGACIYPIGWLGLKSGLTLCVQCVAGVTVYMAGCWLFKLEAFAYAQSLAKSISFAGLRPSRV